MWKVTTPAYLLLCWHHAVLKVAATLCRPERSICSPVELSLYPPQVTYIDCTPSPYNHCEVCKKRGLKLMTWNRPTPRLRTINPASPLKTSPWYNRGCQVHLRSQDVRVVHTCRQRKLWLLILLINHLSAEHPPEKSAPFLRGNYSTWRNALCCKCS